MTSVGLADLVALAFTFSLAFAVSHFQATSELAEQQSSLLI